MGHCQHVRFAEGSKVLSSTILSMCTGRALEIDYHKNFWEGSRAPQYMFEGLDGFYNKIAPASSSSKISRETEDIRSAFGFMKEHGPQDNSDGQFVSWTEEQVNDTTSPLYKWERGVVKKFLRCQADKRYEADRVADWPLTLADCTPWAVNTVISAGCRIC